MPSQDDTLADLSKVLSNVPTHDCVCLLGDLNEQVGANIQGHTGKWTGGPASKNASKITELMRLNQLAAVNTMFQPKRNKSVCTFLQTESTGSDKVNDFGKYVGRKVKAKYSGKWIPGVVENMHTDKKGNIRWSLRFDDGHVTQASEKDLQHMLVYERRKQIGRQLDYVLVSKRWLSSIENCKVCWGPAIHRDLHGHKNDHALLSCRWSWKIRSHKPARAKDFSVLTKNDKEGKAIREKFDATVEKKLATLAHSQKDDTRKLYHDMCAAISHAVDTVLPTVPKQRRVKRKVSERTKALYEKRSNMQGCTNGEYKALQAQIKQAGLDDYRQWVAAQGEVLAEANGRGDTKKIYEVVNALKGKSENPSKNLTTNGQGKLLQGATETADRWYDFLSAKFEQTDREKHERPDMPTLPNTQGVDNLTMEEVRKGVAKMKANRACGPDEIPVEVFQNCPKCMDLLINLIIKIWHYEEVPADFAQATFVMLYKQKGSSDDPTKYRCLAMLNHAYKILSQCLLARLEKETAAYLSEWQAGFRSKRGCRDNILTLRTIYDWVLAEQKELHISFIDYSAAFDSVSHKFIDRALQRANASAKTRALFRAIYAAANARTAVSGVDGQTVFSKSFNIRRGVVQGDITSPLYFILALELILELHDRHPDKGINLGGTNIHTLGYADDAALLDYDVVTASERVTSISQGSRQDADMEISVPKTKGMHVSAQGEVTKTTNEEAKRVCKFKCPNIGCHRVFYNKRGMKCHAGKCKWKDEFLIDKILDARGPARSSKQEFLIRWKGYGREHDSWQPRGNIDPDYVVEFLKANGLYDYSWTGARCPCCDLPCKSKHGVKIHLKSCRYVAQGEQNFAGTLADKKVRRDKVEEAQKLKTAIRCEGAKLENVFLFKYLGSLFSADGNHERDVEKRCAMAMSRCGDLRAVFNSENIPLALKLKIYKTAVCSLLTYGSEAWRLDKKTIAKINGCNARCLSHITHKTAHEEASKKTQTFDLVAAIRKRRHKWLGHILRLKGHRYVKEAVKAQLQLNLPGNITMDSPPLKFEELTKLAQDRAEWRKSTTHIGADASGVKKPVSLPILLKQCDDNKCVITMSSTTVTDLKRRTMKNAWDKILKTDNDKCSNSKNKRREGKCKKTSKQAGWSERQRTNWARAHYQLTAPRENCQ